MDLDLNGQAGEREGGANVLGAPFGLKGKKGGLKDSCSRQKGDDDQVGPGLPEDYGCRKREGAQQRVLRGAQGGEGRKKKLKEMGGGGVTEAAGGRGARDT